MEEVITIRELMVLFHHSTADADTYLDAVDREEYYNRVKYMTDQPLKEP